MKIAVVGAGIFGVTFALKLSREHDVTLYEKNSDIMTAASRANQLRLHRGYHYPRSPETVRDLLRSIVFFEKEYKDAVVGCHEHFYCISKNDSMTSAKQYLDFCNEFNLEYQVIENFSHVCNNKIDLTVKVNEKLLDYYKIYNMSWERLLTSNIKRRFLEKFSKDDIDCFDIVLNCTYANINELLEVKSQREYQFEICEKILVKMPDEMINKSIVVMDGPFMCVDPNGKTGLSLLGNVVHAIHSTNTGTSPTVPSLIQKDLDSGVVRNPTSTNWKKFIEAGREYIPSLANAEYRGSMFTTRAVLPNMDKTDARPTIVSRSGTKIINVFSGKIDTCVMAAHDSLSMISEQAKL